MLNRIFAFATMFALTLGLAGAMAQTAAEPSAEDIFKTMDFKTGTITLGDNLATLKLTDKFRYLDPKDAEKMIVQIWGNPPSAAEGNLGMIMPVGEEGLEDWAVVLSYEDSGYVSDEDAAAINYDDLLKDMQEAVAEDSKDRVSAGYASIALLGWARKPFYDAKTKKMYWAKRLQFGDQKLESLNYEIRILGRRGVLDLNAVADMDALASINEQVTPVLAMVDFQQGNTYAEFDPKVDKVAAYGLAGLVAGGVLAKAGFFKVLIGLILAGKKFIFLAGAAIVAFFGKFFRRLTGRAKPEQARMFPADNPAAPAAPGPDGEGPH